MSWNKPDRSVLSRAIKTYVEIAYRGAPPPTAVRSRIDALAAHDADALYVNPVFERDKSNPPVR